MGALIRTWLDFKFPQIVVPLQPPGTCRWIAAAHAGTGFAGSTAVEHVAVLERTVLKPHVVENNRGPLELFPDSPHVLKRYFTHFLPLSRRLDPQGPREFAHRLESSVKLHVQIAFPGQSIKNRLPFRRRRTVLSELHGLRVFETSHAPPQRFSLDRVFLRGSAAPCQSGPSFVC